MSLSSIKNALESDLSQTRYFDFLKVPYDGLSDRLKYQLLPAWKAELDRKGLGNITDLEYFPLPPRPSRELRLRELDREEKDSRYRLYVRQEQDYREYVTDYPPDKRLLEHLRPMTQSSDLAVIKEYQDETKKQEMESRKALGIFQRMLTATVQNDLRHIFDDSTIHSRLKLHRIVQHLQKLCPPDSRLANDIIIEMDRLPSATTFASALVLASQLRDLQNELRLIHPDMERSPSLITLTLTQKLQDPQFLALRMQISAFQKKRQDRYLSRKNPYLFMDIVRIVREFRNEAETYGNVSSSTSLLANSTSIIVEGTGQSAPTFSPWGPQPPQPMYPPYAFPGPYHPMMFQPFPPMMHPGLHHSSSASSSSSGRPQQSSSSSGRYQQSSSRPRQIKFGHPRTNSNVDYRHQQTKPPLPSTASSSPKVVSSTPARPPSLPPTTRSKKPRLDQQSAPMAHFAHAYLPPFSYPGTFTLEPDDHSSADSTSRPATPESPQQQTSLSESD
jgi:hypothetical protein